jgi:biopolymer transport protein ExbD
MAIAVGRDEGDPMVEPNVIPLVDVMLVLLIIMIITIPVMTHAVKIDLLKEVNRTTETKPENINISIDFDGSIYWNENSLELFKVGQHAGGGRQGSPAGSSHPGRQADAL